MASGVPPADGSPDVLTQARTPTEEEFRAGLAGYDAYYEEARLVSADTRSYVHSEVDHISQAVLAKAAPRILALAYREAARTMEQGWVDETQAGDKSAAEAYWNAKEHFESLADSVERSQ